MTTYVYRPGHPQASKTGLVDKSLLEGYEGGLAPYVISDTMTETRHMATGRHHTSKAAFRRDTKASGCVEIGNDTSFMKPRVPIPLSREKRRDDIRKTIYDLRNGRRS